MFFAVVVFIVAAAAGYLSFEATEKSHLRQRRKLLGHPPKGGMLRRMLRLGPRDYWEWRESDRANALYYQSLAQFAPRALLLNGYNYHNAAFAEILNTDFGPQFWAMWTISPQAMLAYDMFTHPQCTPHGWLCYNWVLLMTSHAIAEFIVFAAVLLMVGPWAGAVAWSQYVVYRLIVAQLGVCLVVWLLFPITPFWLSDFFNAIQVYVSGLLALLDISGLIYQHAGLATPPPL